MTEPTWYILYDGQSVDGRGNPEFYKRTIDKQEAMEHWKKCKDNPYSTGKVVAYTDEQQITFFWEHIWSVL